jgi:two-component system, NtrC family, nitrogen regulation sensor histidine kinase NtrY
MYFLIIKTDYIISIFASILLLTLIINLLSYVNKTNRDFTNFLTSFVHNDFTIHYSGKNKGRSFDKLYQTFEQIQAQFRSLNFEKEVVNQHLQNLVKHIDVGIISLDKDQNIQLINEAFKMMFGLPNLTFGQPLSKVSTTFINIAREIKPNEKKLIKLKINKVLQQMVIHADVYKLNGHEYKLISLKNIHGELDEREMESYQKLIRVLTHEIMNTLSPIISLSGTINQSIKDLVHDQNPLDTETGNYLNEGIEAIQDRSQGLLKFTEAYRKLMRLPQPKLKLVDTNNYFNKFHLLFNQQIQDRNIEFTFSNSDDQDLLFIDPELFEQVLINIYKNAIESFDQFKAKKKPSFIPLIKTHILKKDERLIEIKISDNGCGMESESQEKAFIPFYTTKEEGSGIGLSLSKQIVLLHKGSINFESKAENGTTVSIFLNT